jgi:hypothetical protein
VDIVWVILSNTHASVSAYFPTSLSPEESKHTARLPPFQPFHTPIAACCTVSGYAKPFVINVHTDRVEQTITTGAADNGNMGFCLNFIQQPCVAAVGK